MKTYIILAALTLVAGALALAVTFAPGDQHAPARQQAPVAAANQQAAAPAAVGIFPKAVNR